MYLPRCSSPPTTSRERPTRSPRARRWACRSSSPVRRCGPRPGGGPTPPGARAAVERLPDTAVVVSEGAPEDAATREAVLRRADVVRADVGEAALLVGRELDGVDDARDAAAELLTAGPRLVALAVGTDGDLVSWRAGPALGIAAEELDADPRWADGEVLVPLLGEPGVDPTGGSDAFVAALIAAVLGESGPEDAAWVAAAAASLSVAHTGGRPELSPGSVGELVRRSRGG